MMPINTLIRRQLQVRIREICMNPEIAMMEDSPLNEFPSGTPLAVGMVK